MYKVPKEEEVRKAIYRSLKKHGSFSSLYQLREGVLQELRKMDDEYTISIPRTRTVTARSGFVKITVKKRHERKKMDKCPVCGKELKKIKNLSLLGEEVVVGYACTLCGYRGKINEGPLRYIFHLSR
ncbi:MAG TPA: hypothetical protein ENG06_01355 [Thermoplasmatales archaeon]|nr:MAG: hypothetical protein DRN07_04735 [Thermoplasmata archaeon]HDN50405.1 hypothetical protein [Thermoplasmatales archaeon]